MMLSIVTLSLGLCGTVLLMVAPLTRSCRGRSRWIRSTLFIVGPIGIAWSAIGFFLLIRGAEISAQAHHTLSVVKTGLGGMVIGILIALFLSPEFWSFGRWRKV